MYTKARDRYNSSYIEGMMSLLTSFSPMNHLKYKPFYSFVLLLFLLPLISACLFTPGSSEQTPLNHNTIQLEPRVIGTSQLAPGISLVDQSLNDMQEQNNGKAVQNVETLIKGGIAYVNTPIMAWGAEDPWPDPLQPEPKNWDSLDNRLHLVQKTGGVAVITLCEAPWWMKGQLQPYGKTRQLTSSQEWDGIAYSSRILDNKMDAWLHLVQRVAERYMVAPYNVRYFQVWNELKGYFNPTTNEYDYTMSTGDQSGPNAKHGYTYMYNRVYGRLLSVARSLGIAENSIKVGGPYTPMNTWSSDKQSTTSTITKAYGTYDRRPLDVLKYWLQHKAGAGFITVDGANRNEDNVDIADPFTASEKFADVTTLIRSLDSTASPDAATLPIWWAEWYAQPYTNAADANYNNAIESYALVKLLKAGGAIPLLWGGLGVAGTGLWTNTTIGGGQPLPLYATFKAFKDYFGPGTLIYKGPMVPGVETLASATKIMLINKTAKNIIVPLNKINTELAPYQVRVVNYNA